MKSLTDNMARDALKRFLDGETTVAQERELYRFFAQPALPPDLEPYREMFGWYQSLVDDKAASTPPRPAIKRWIPWLSIAASVAVVAIIGAWMMIGDRDADDPLLAYAGSYVIENGVKRTDIREILPRLQEAERLADKISEEQPSIDFGDDDSTLAVALDGITDPETRRLIIEALK